MSGECFLSLHTKFVPQHQNSIFRLRAAHRAYCFLWLSMLTTRQDTFTKWVREINMRVVNPRTAIPFCSVAASERKIVWLSRRSFFAVCQTQQDVRFLKTAGSAKTLLVCENFVPQFNWGSFQKFDFKRSLISAQRHVRVRGKLVRNQPIKTKFKSFWPRLVTVLTSNSPKRTQ